MASIDTHRRYVQYQVQKQLDEGLLNHLDLLKFIVATVDNIDFLQRHSMVYCGDQGRSWHGTAVQVMQPNNMTKVSDAGEESSAQHSSLVVSADTSAHAGAGSSAIAGEHPSVLPGGILSSAHAGGIPLVGDHRSTLAGGTSLLPLEEFGWNNDGGKLTVKWESDQNIQNVRSRVAFLTHGYNCKTGCGTKRCKCVKAEHPCGPGCSCTKHNECQKLMCQPHVST